jgi:hypothetical protein
MKPSNNLDLHVVTRIPVLACGVQKEFYHAHSQSRVNRCRGMSTSIKR